MLDISLIRSLGAARRPADHIAIADLRQTLRLPAVIAELYTLTDGFLLPSGITVYSTVDLAERTATYEIDIYAPHHVLIGDDSGGMGFLVARDGGPTDVYRSDLGDLDPAGFTSLAPTLGDWLASLE